MRNLEPFRLERAKPIVELACRPLPAFDRNDLADIRRAFEYATPCPLQQAWLDEPVAVFQPGHVRTGWQGNSLLIFAELADNDIFNSATRLNQRAWELGDAFEIFLSAEGREGYAEFQITPNNQRLQLRYNDSGAAERARKSGSLDNFLVGAEIFHSATWVEHDLCQWSVFAAIPALSVCGTKPPVEGTQWRFSFARYDYTRGADEPVISSSSPHAKPDFHRQHEWGVLTFKNSPVTPVS